MPFVKLSFAKEFLQFLERKKKITIGVKYALSRFFPAAESLYFLLSLTLSK